jgi:hypothetical protein
MVLWGLNFAPKGTSAAGVWFCMVITVEISFEGGQANGLMVQALFIFPADPGFRPWTSLVSHSLV